MLAPDDHLTSGRFRQPGHLCSQPAGTAPELIAQPPSRLERGTLDLRAIQQPALRFGELKLGQASLGLLAASAGALVILRFVVYFWRISDAARRLRADTSDGVLQPLRIGDCRIEPAVGVERDPPALDRFGNRSFRAMAAPCVLGLREKFGHEVDFSQMNG